MAPVTDLPSNNVRDLSDVPSVEVISKAAIMLLSSAAERLGLADEDPEHSPRRDLDEARQLMETQIAQFPQIQEFQSLVLAYVLLRAGDTEGALRLYRDNVELLETRFRDDYTDPDPLLSETLYLYGVLADANGEEARADSLYGEAERWGWTDFRKRGQHGQRTDDRSPHPVPGDPPSHT